MPYYQAEPPYQQGSQARVGVLLINLGTPDEPTPKALRCYLKAFLSDRRVIETPRLIWWLILHGVILNTYPAKSAEKYAKIWDHDGSPLLTHTRRQATLLQGYLGERGIAVRVAFGMRYGNPAVASALAELKAQNCDRILVIPLYPQYAASTTASALDAVWQVLERTRNMPEIRTVRHYHDHPAYLAALAASVRDHWMAHGQPDKLLMSFHGLPVRATELGDPYHRECLETGQLLAKVLGLLPEQYLVCFQSRFGRAEWLQPYFSTTLESLAKQRVRRVDVICPGFASDCLETLEEVAQEGKATFLAAGGGEYHYIPALNERNEWIHALADIAAQHLAGWDTDLPDDGPKSLLDHPRSQEMSVSAKL